MANLQMPQRAFYANETSLVDARAPYAPAVPPAALAGGMGLLQMLAGCGVRSCQVACDQLGYSYPYWVPAYTVPASKSPLPYSGLRGWFGRVLGQAPTTQQGWYELAMRAFQKEQDGKKLTTLEKTALDWFKSGGTLTGKLPRVITTGRRGRVGPGDSYTRPEEVPEEELPINLPAPTFLEQYRTPLLIAVAVILGAFGWRTLRRRAV